MNNFTTELNKLLVKNEFNLEISLKELIKDNIQIALNELLKDELTAFLDYEKYERYNSDNYRNGFYSRVFNTSYGEITLNIPRDRKCEFSSPLIPKYSRHDLTTENTILKLFQTGLTNDEIAEIIESLYYKKYSKTTITNITNNVVANIEKFKTRPIVNNYAVIYTDATYVCLRRDTTSKEAIHIAIGIRPNGNKEVLGYKIAPTESCEIWRELLQDLISRGLEKASLFCTDGLAGFTNVVEELFTDVKIQRCIVHLQRNILAKVRVKDRKEIAEDFKNVYTQKDLDLATEKLEIFKDKWKIYPQVVKMLNTTKYMFTYYEFPPEIRSSIYTTNIIEGFNKQLKRKIIRKEQFPTEESLEKVLVTMFEEYNQKFLNRVHKGFSQIPISFWD